MWGFGTATRDQFRKVFTSQEQQHADFYGTQSPGPATYLLPNSVGGKQPDGRKPDPPSWLFGGSRENRMPTAEDCMGRDTPGACQSGGLLPGGIGKQPDSGHDSAPKWGFASKARTPVEAGLDTPGAKYHLDPALAKQASSKKRSAPRPTFSCHSRWAHLEREKRENSVPGPGYYG